jgi:hypothetical protein
MSSSVCAGILNALDPRGHVRRRGHLAVEKIRRGWPAHANDLRGFSNRHALGGQDSVAYMLARRNLMGALSEEDSFRMGTSI